MSETFTKHKTIMAEGAVFSTLLLGPSKTKVDFVGGVGFAVS
jgi:hypothetical protein